MDDAELLAAKHELEQTYGHWTAHNIRLSEDVYTIGQEPSGDEVKLRRIVQVVSDLFEGRVDGVRALDLACLEGMYALELGRRGAEVVGIEGREANLEKARFAAHWLGLERVEFVLDDVRNLDAESHGMFDVVLCLGILYHLDVPDVFTFVEQMAAVCTRALVVDTHVALEAEETQTHYGRDYLGRHLFEHDPKSSEEERLKALWSSLDNPKAFAPTRPSLLSLLARAGFTTVFEVHVPAEPEKTQDRITLVALKGTPQLPLLTPPPVDDPATVPEQTATRQRASLRARARNRGRRHL